MNQRFYSLDVFRGATVALMILVNNPGTWSHIYAPLDHASWHGCTPTDLVFPFFLFAVGNALAFVMPRLEERDIFWQKILRRSLLIFAIGLFLNWFPFIKWDNNMLVGKPWRYITADGKEAGVRILGVLQRIAICYLFASIIIHYFKVKGSFVLGVFILLAYWFLCIAGNPSDPYSIHGWFGTKGDLNILHDAHMYHGEGIAFDPEGFMSVFAAIVQVIFGYLVGNYIVTKGKSYEMLAGLFMAGCVLVLCGFCWDMVFPINKKIWTSSYTIYTTGLAILILSVLMYIIEFNKKETVPVEKTSSGKRDLWLLMFSFVITLLLLWLSGDGSLKFSLATTIRICLIVLVIYFFLSTIILNRWGRFFDVFGKNALFIFAISGILPRALALVRIPNGLDATGKIKYTGPLGWFYDNACAPLFIEPRNGSLMYALCFIMIMWGMVWWLDKKKIYIRV